MKKITKTAKKVSVKWVKQSFSRSCYVCPTCSTTFYGVVHENVTRFICDCGQELIVNIEDSNK